MSADCVLRIVVRRWSDDPSWCDQDLFELFGAGRFDEVTVKPRLPGAKAIPILAKTAQRYQLR